MIKRKDDQVKCKEIRQGGLDLEFTPAAKKKPGRSITTFNYPQQNIISANLIVATTKIIAVHMKA